MKKTYVITTYQDKETYTVTLNEKGVVDVDGLPSDLAASLAFTVKRFMGRYEMAPITALGKAVGPYSVVTEVDGGPVTDSTPAHEVL